MRLRPCGGPRPGCSAAPAPWAGVSWKTRLAQKGLEIREPLLLLPSPIQFGSLRSAMGQPVIHVGPLAGDEIGKLPGPWLVLDLLELRIECGEMVLDVPQPFLGLGRVGLARQRPTISL